MMELETRISGIPCVVRLEHYRKQEPLGPGASSDVDCYGYTEYDLVVLDRRGRVAPWLQRKMTEQEENRIILEFEDIMKADAEDGIEYGDW